MRFLVGGASGWSLPTAVETVADGRGSGQRWKNDGIMLVPVVGFLLLVVTRVNGISSMIMLLSDES